MFKPISQFIVHEIKNHIMIDSNKEKKSILLKNTESLQLERFAFFGFTSDQTGLKLGMFYKNAHGFKRLRPITAYIRTNRECKMFETFLQYTTTHKLLAHKGGYFLEVCQVISRICVVDYCKDLPIKLQLQHAAKQSF
jgi:hypothetical protein